MRIIALLLCAVMLVSGSLAAQQTTTASATVNAERLNVRQSATIDAAILTTLRKGVTVRVLERTESWAKIESGTTIGWVRTSSLVLTDAGAATPASAPAPTPTPTPTRAPSPTPTSAVQPPSSTPAPTPATTTPAPKPTPAENTNVPASASAAKTSSTPVGGSPRRTNHHNGFRVGILGSATPAPEIAGVKTENHLAALPLVLLQGSWLGLYLAPEIGTGAGYRSIMLGGGLSLRLATLGPLQVRAMGGMTTYQATVSGSDSLGGGDVVPRYNAASVGGLVTLRVIGPMKLAFRGQHVLSVGEPAKLTFNRYALGLVF